MDAIETVCNEFGVYRHMTEGAYRALLERLREAVWSYEFELAPEVGVISGLTVATLFPEVADQGAVTLPADDADPAVVVDHSILNADHIT